MSEQDRVKASNWISDGADLSGLTTAVDIAADPSAAGGMTDLEGLSAARVQERISRGQVNTSSLPRSKSVRQIVADHILTTFVLINVILFILILSTGRYINTLFMGVVVSNILIGIIQEIRAKRIIDRLSILTDVRAAVVRDGQEVMLPLDEMVLDDVFRLRPGNQVSTDGLVLQSEELEVDESLLTGEPEAVLKAAGDSVLSGSFVVAGNAYVRAVHVGAENYAQKITAEARKYKKAHSEILTTLNTIIKAISILIVPVGLLLFFSQYLRNDLSWQDAIVGSAAGVIGMIPEGLVLLTSMTLAVGIIKLAMRRTVVQDLAGIEVLARVNVLCLDKTGTLTTGILKVHEVQPLGSFSLEQVQTAIAATTSAFTEKNATSQALAAYHPTVPDWTMQTRVPFSSARRWSGATFTERGTWLIGAPEKMLAGDAWPELAELARKQADQGYRVLLLATSSQSLAEPQPLSELHSRPPAELQKNSQPQLLADMQLPLELQPAALILLADTIRPEARDAIRYFIDHDVAIKIISGDNPVTVASIARQLDLPFAERYVDATSLGEDPAALAEAAKSQSIFGRVTPRQKQLLIRALKDSGKTVAMTGDGVNDVLALREADCSMVMASGSDAAKNTAHIVLLDSDFTVLPGVVAEGRQVINNVERVASLFLTKTAYSMLLSVIFIILGQQYPFAPIHQTLIGTATIGIPGFFLAMEKNVRRIQPGFLRRVLQKAIPGGLLVVANILIIRLLQSRLGLDDGQVQAVSVILTAVIALQVVWRVSLPATLLHGMLILAMVILFAGEWLFLAGPIGLPTVTGPMVLLIAALGILAWPIMRLMGRIFTRTKKQG